MILAACGGVTWPIAGLVFALLIGFTLLILALGWAMRP